MSRGQVVLAWAPAVLTMGVIWLVSSLAPIPLSRFPLGDKGVHLVEYGVLGLLLTHAAFRTWPRHHPWRTALLAVLVACLWGLLDEIHQGMVPGRASDAIDLLADAAGAIIGAAVRSAFHLFTLKLAPNEER